MNVDTVVKNCRIVSSHDIVSAGIGIDDGKIVVIAKDTKLPQADNTIDCKGKFVLPGAIEPHVHFGSYFPFSQDCKTETEAAAMGGITSVMHHLIYKGSYSKVFADHKRMAEENSLIDFSFHFAVMSEEHLAELDDYVREGITSFKFFMAYRGEEGEQIGITAADDGMLFEGFQRIGKIGYPGLPLIHAENVEIAYRLKSKLISQGREDLAAWSEARPNFCEEENVVRAASIARLKRFTSLRKI
jgi:dihydroorotase-like cyclic amidohydrolase